MKKSNLSTQDPSGSNKNLEGENLSKNDHQSTPELKKEIEKDENGTIEHLQRARYVDKNMEDSKPVPKIDFPTESIHQTATTAEHKDFNSNPNPNEYPNQGKKNKENRGNIEQ